MARLFFSRTSASHAFCLRALLPRLPQGNSAGWNVGGKVQPVLPYRQYLPPYQNGRHYFQSSPCIWACTGCRTKLVRLNCVSNGFTTSAFFPSNRFILHCFLVSRTY